MRNAKSVHYFQIDHRIKNISRADGIEILPAKLTWERYSWTQKYFLTKPKEGYFIWVKKQINFPLLTCISVAQKNTKQELRNLIIVEKKLNIKIRGACNAQKRNLCSFHKAQGKIILKEGSTLKYEHIHSWGQKDIVNPDYEFSLEKNSKLDYNFKSFFSPKKLQISTLINIFEGARANMKIVADCNRTETKIMEAIILKEKGSSGQIQLRLVGRENSKTLARSQILAEAEGKGHLDCQSLLVDKNAKISLTPKLICQNKKAQITHEASIGKIEEEQLNYLRMRGLSEAEATDLIINGFLSV